MVVRVGGLVGGTSVVGSLHVCRWRWLVGRRGLVLGVFLVFLFFGTGVWLCCCAGCGRGVGFGGVGLLTPFTVVFVIVGGSTTVGGWVLSCMVGLGCWVA